MNISNRRASAISIALLALVVLGLATGVVHQRLAASRTKREIAEQKTLLVRYRSQSYKCVDSQKDYKEFCLKIGGRLPECSWSDQMPFMLSQVEGILAPRGLKMETLQPQPMFSYRNVLRFPVRIGLQADLAGLIGLLEDFEKTNPLLEVDRLDMRNAQGQGDKLQVDITLSSFVVLDPTSPVVKRRAVRPANEPPKVSDTVAALQTNATAAQAQPTPGKAAPPPVPASRQGNVPMAPGGGAMPKTPPQPIRVSTGGPK